VERSVVNTVEIAKNFSTKLLFGRCGFLDVDLEQNVEVALVRRSENDALLGVELNSFEGVELFQDETEAYDSVIAELLLDLGKAGFDLLGQALVFEHVGSFVVLHGVDHAVEERLVDVNLLELLHILSELPLSVDLSLKLLGSLVVVKAIEVNLDQIGFTVKQGRLSHHHVEGQVAFGHKSLANFLVDDLPVVHVDQ